MSTALMSDIPFVEARHSGRKQRPKVVSLRLTETTSKHGAAMGIARYWNASNSPIESCHYVVDEELTLQCVPVDKVAYSSKFDAKGTISINVCAFPTFDVNEWLDTERAEALDNAAKLTARLSKAHNIPIRYVDLLDHRRIFSRGGIMVNVRGSWPTHTFLTKVEAYRS